MFENVLCSNVGHAARNLQQGLNMQHNYLMRSLQKPAVEYQVTINSIYDLIHLEHKKNILLF